MITRGALAAALVLGCRDDTQRTPLPSPSEATSTTLVVSEPLDAAVPDCLIHVASASFANARASAAGTVRVEGDYTRTFAKVNVERKAGGGWSGTFNGPRDAFMQMLKGRLCTASHVYALKPRDNADPSKGVVTLDAFDLQPDEKADVDSLCHAMSHVPADAGADRDLRDHAAMEWVEDALTTTKWDEWRRSFARERASLFAQQQAPSSLFQTRGNELASAASALGVACPTVAEWKKR